MKGRFILVAVILITLSIPVLSFGGDWELYDDFSSGALDAQKWANNSSVSTVIVENGQLKLVHNSGFPAQSGYIQFIQNPETIMGMKASVTITSCSGDVRPRMAGNSGSLGSDIYWTGLQFQPARSRIYTVTSLEDSLNNYDLVAETHYAQFQTPLNLIGNTYIASMVFYEDKISYEVEGLGKIAFKYPTVVDTTTENWRVIGTRSSNGEGPCTVYIDDVYVLRR